MDAGIKALMALMVDVIKLLDRYEIKRRERTERREDNGRKDPDPQA